MLGPGGGGGFESRENLSQVSIKRFKEKMQLLRLKQNDENTNNQKSSHFWDIVGFRQKKKIQIMKQSSFLGQCRLPPKDQ
jgi:hypothetical protein